MTAPLSIIIPTLNAADVIGPTLATLAEGLGEGLIAELILTDGGSTDDIAQVAEAAGAQFVVGPPGRGGQLARGCAVARGAWLLILHADSRPDPGWPAAVRAHLADHPDRAGFFDLRFDEVSPPARWTAGWANWRARWLGGLPYGDQGLLISAGLYHQTGGYPDIPLMEDVALADRLARRLRPLGHAVTTSAARYRQSGWLRRGAQNLTTLLLYRLGRDPVKLARRYRR